MKVEFVIATSVVLAIASSDLLQLSDPASGYASHEDSLNLAGKGEVLQNEAYPAIAVTAADTWEKAKDVGLKLVTGMTKDDKEAAKLFDPNSLTVQSVFDGDLKETLEKWGYDEPPEEKAKIDKDCDFDTYHHIKTAFNNLLIDTRSKGNGGSNQCFEISHADGPKVLRDENGILPPVDQQRYIDESCGKEYRVTWGTFEFGINPDAGLIALLNVRSPAYSASKLWGHTPAADELPHIRSISDVGWGFWNRACKENVKKINYLMVAQIMNSDTRDIIRQAHMTLTPQRSETAVWPGYEFPTDGAAGQALLGSSVGRWAGYFLMQHKQQLGGNKYIYKIRVFKPDQGSLPFMLFYVAGPAPGDEGGELLAGARGSLRKRANWNGNDRLLKREGNHILREHVVQARL